jgi:BolA protein
MSLHKTLEKKLIDAFMPVHLDVVNDSDKHHGHAGSPQSGESHFTIRIQANAFKDISRVKAHQMIYAVLNQEFKEGLHALSIEIL